MSTSGSPRGGAPQDQLPFIRRNAHLLQKLPQPGERWRSDAIPEELANRLAGLQNKEIVRRVDRVEMEEWKKLRCIWETNSEAYERILEVLEGDDRDGILPCGHSAINNERGVDGITCGVCGEVHDRDEVDLNRGEAQ